LKVGRRNDEGGSIWPISLAICPMTSKAVFLIDGLAFGWFIRGFMGEEINVDRKKQAEKCQKT
jgi:hypothetical protein